MTEAARASFRESFYEATDPGLAERDRRRIAEANYRLHMLDLSRRAAAARTARAAGNAPAGPA